VTLTVSAGRQRLGAGDRGRGARKRAKSWKAPVSGPGRNRQLRLGRRKACDNSETVRRQAATHGSDVTLFVSAGPKLAKVPVLVGTKRRVGRCSRSAAAASEAERLRRGKLLADGEVIRQ